MTQTLPQDPAGAVERVSIFVENGYAADHALQFEADLRLILAERAALLTRLETAEGERDEAKADRKAANDHALEVASEARDGFDALDFMDEAWAATGYPGNRKHLTLAEQISSIVRERDQAEARLSDALACERLKDEALRLAVDFIEEEADNRSAAGSEHSDYEREPRELAERIRQALEGQP